MLFGFGSGQDYGDSTQVIAFASAGGLGLPDRDYYLKTDAESQETRGKYVEHLQRMFILLGDPPERVDVGPQSVVAVQPNTPLQVRNEGSEELVLYIYGAPPEQEGADFFDDPGDL